MEKVNFRTISSAPLPIPKKIAAPPGRNGTSFSQQLNSVLNQSPTALTISRHAQERLQQRKIQIDPQIWGKLEEKVYEAKKMGVQDSLVLLKNAALIVSAKNSTVITAMDRAEASAHIFTNINGTIVME
ncbi:TIGR02530 family flagellar biosynthesis protein [Peribacillus kribbensis]|uniref:TIGR02530 family flagellar biosynthesis protein n=1 Tax=Peribacillus kribbensis TaxID=356658 RepID=UPI0003F94966|nr:TIGR02530 family flagellar biosynthesis protein [Peribacillus kribbensis]